MSPMGRLLQRGDTRRVLVGLTGVVALCAGVFLVFGHLKVAKYDKHSKFMALQGVGMSAVAYSRDKGQLPVSVEELISAGYIRSYYDKDKKGEYAAFAPGTESSVKWEDVEAVILAFPPAAYPHEVMGHVLIDKVTGKEFRFVRIRDFEAEPSSTVREGLTEAWLDAARKKLLPMSQATVTQVAE